MKISIGQSVDNIQEVFFSTDIGDIDIDIEPGEIDDGGGLYVTIIHEGESYEGLIQTNKERTDNGNTRKETQETTDRDREVEKQ